MKEELPETAHQEKKKEPEWMTQFIYTATHELRTPLTSIKGYVYLIQTRLNKRQEDQKMDELRKMVDVVAKNTERMEALIDDVLEMRRIIDGRLEISMSRQMIAEFLNYVAEEMKPILDNKSQRLQVDSRVETLVFGRERLGQVLQNLINNSSKFSRDGSTIWLQVGKVDDVVKFSVTDEGIGLSPEDISKLFKPFPKIDKPGSYQGTGLGLSICNGIVELHGGKMWAESPGRGGGSTFFFTIPDNNP